MAPKQPKSNPLWGGHYNRGPAEIMTEINSSIETDWLLFREDILASKAHAAMLAKQEIINQQELSKITQGLGKIEQEILDGKFTFKPELEDIHMHVESRLAELIGDAAGKLHTARSRNDQVATDFKLWVRGALMRMEAAVIELANALIDQAESHAETILPGMTHLQPAQPVTFGHHLMAYVEMLGRDRARIQSALEHMQDCPLGAAALAGTSFPLDREMTAKALGFARPSANSIDAVSDRDFALEFLSVAAIAATHLSRLAEEIVFWTSPLLGFAKLSEAYTTGSSIMPQKRNPDAAELVRAKTGVAMGNMTRLLTVMKGLPLAYSKDMQEDKAGVFEASEAVQLSLEAMAGMVADLKVDAKAMLKATEKGYLTATDLADWLVQNLGIPFRKAHHLTGKIVRFAESNSLLLEKVPLREMQKVEPKITQAIFSVLSVPSSVKSRTSFGGTAPKRVKEAIKKARKSWQN